MAQGIDTGLDFAPCERGRLSSKIFSQIIPCAAALALSALFGFWILYLRLAAPNAVEAPAAAHATVSSSIWSVSKRSSAVGRLMRARSRAMP
jgi:hypothetical protein